MKIGISDPSEISKWRWVICCPCISESSVTEVNEWLDGQGVMYVNVGARYWIEREADKNWFIMRWS